MTTKTARTLLLVAWSTFCLLVLFSPHSIGSDPQAAPVNTAEVCNGGFETGALEPCWITGGELPVQVSTACAYTGRFGVQLGAPVQPTPLPAASAFLTQTIHIPDGQPAPHLSLAYRIFTNDVLGWASLYVNAREANGGPAVVLAHDGYPGTEIPITLPVDLGWRKAWANLTSFIGKDVQIWIDNHQGTAFGADGSWGIWTCVDDVEIAHAKVSLLPLIGRGSAVPIPNPTPTATPTPTPTPIPTDTPPPIRARLYVVPATATPTVGQASNVAVWVDAPDLFAGEIRLRFDPEKIEPLPADPQQPDLPLKVGPVFAEGLILFNTIQGGEIRFVATLKREARPWNGPGVVFLFYYRPLVATTSRLEFTVTKLVSVDEIAIPHERSNGEIQPR